MIRHLPIRTLVMVGLVGAALPAAGGTLRIPEQGIADIGTAVKAMTSIAEGRYVVVVENGADSMYVIDTVSRDQDAVAPCASSSITAVAGDGTERIYVGCKNGSLTSWDVDPNGLTEVGDPLSLGGGEVMALEVHRDKLYAFLSEEAGSASWLTVDIDGAPVLGGATDNRIQSIGAVRRAVSGTGGLVITTANGVERLDPQGALQVGLEQGYDDAVSAGTSFILTSDNGQLYLYTGNATGGITVVSAPGIDNNASSLGVIDSRLVVGTTDQQLRFYNRSSSGTPSELFAAISPPGSGAFGDPVDIVEGEGVSVAGTTQGFLWYVTDGPWVEIEDPDAAIAGVSGTEFQLSFTSDTDGTARVRLNGSSDNTGADISGTIDVTADEPVTLDLAMDEAYSEGANELRVVVTDSDGDAGRDILTVTRDDPPGAVRFTNISANNSDDKRVALGNQRLSVEWRLLDDPDIESYVVFFSNEEFTAADWEDCEDTRCGPKYTSKAGASSPIVINEWSGSTHQVDLEPLVNYQRYWIAVRAYDEGGKEGPMSDILSGVPEPGLGPAELAGEQGGLQCGTGAGAGLFGLFLGLGAAVSRRRRLGMAAGAGCAAAMLFAPVAEAKDPDAADHRKGHLEFRYGFFTLDDPNINRVMGESKNEVLWLEVGPHIIPQVEINAGLGWFQEIGNPVLSGGGRSDDNVMITALPVNLSLGLRGDFMKHQPVVPSVGVSMEAWPWRQEPYGSGSLSGVKTGWSWNAGLELLLDRMDPSAASKLRVRTGIDDTYLTVSYRSQEVGDPNEGLYYSGTVIGLGLKFDY